MFKEKLREMMESSPAPALRVGAKFVDRIREEDAQAVLGAVVTADGIIKGAIKARADKVEDRKAEKKQKKQDRKSAANAFRESLLQRASSVYSAAMGANTRWDAPVEGIHEEGRP